MTDTIYCLAEVNGLPFYVGRSIDTVRREKEHRSSAKKGTEAKYQFIRQLWLDGTDFELIVLEVNPKERYEQYWHYLLGCQFDLTNQKMGDVQAIHQQVDKNIRKNKLVFEDADAFLLEKDRQIAELKAKMQAAKIQAKLRGEYHPTFEIFDWKEPLYCFEKPSERFMSPAMKEILQRRKK